MVPSMAFCNYEEIIVAKLGKFFCNFVRFYYAINTEYDEQLIRRLIEKVTVYEDKFTVEFKSGVTVDVEE